VARDTPARRATFSRVGRVRPVLTPSRLLRCRQARRPRRLTGSRRPHSPRRLPPRPRVPPRRRFPPTAVPPLCHRRATAVPLLTLSGIAGASRTPVTRSGRESALQICKAFRWPLVPSRVGRQFLPLQVERPGQRRVPRPARRALSTPGRGRRSGPVSSIVDILGCIPHSRQRSSTGDPRWSTPCGSGHPGRGASPGEEPARERI
jgi:hypothetical protein